MARKVATVTTPTSATGRHPRGRAFTLVELLVVLAIMVAMTGLIVPRMARSLVRQNVVEAVARLAQTCRTVRELAIAGGQTCTVELDLDGGSYSVARRVESARGGSWENAKAVWLKPQRWPKDVKIASCRTPDGPDVTAGHVSLRFFPDGRASGLFVRLVAGDQRYDLVVHPHTGRVTYGADDRQVSVPDQYDLGDG
jgi:type II secretion system protein H